MKLPTPKKINVNDYSSASKGDMDKLARSINPFFDDIVRALKKGLTVEANLPFEYVTLEVEVNTSGVPKNNTLISSTLSATIKGCIVVSVQNLTDATPLNGSPFVNYTLNGKVLTVSQVTGLPANKKYKLNLMLVS